MGRHKNLIREALYFFAGGCVLIALLFASCNQQEDIVVSIEDVNPADIFYDCTISGDEESGMAYLKFHLRWGDENGSPLKLGSADTVTLSGNPLQEDSSVLKGVYYEGFFPVDKKLTHTLRLAMQEGVFEESFTFNPFYLRDTLPSHIDRREGFTIDIIGLDSVDYIGWLLADTSLYGRDIYRFDTIRNGRLVIDTKSLSRLKSGPVNFQLYKEQEEMFTHMPGMKGRLNKVYILRRDFTLVP